MQILLITAVKLCTTKSLLFLRFPSNFATSPHFLVINIPALIKTQSVGFHYPNSLFLSIVALICCLKCIKHRSQELINVSLLNLIFNTEPFNRYSFYYSSIMNQSKCLSFDKILLTCFWHSKCL